MVAVSMWTYYTVYNDIFHLSFDNRFVRAFVEQFILCSFLIYVKVNGLYLYWIYLQYYTDGE
jgi:hypothetical protein